MTNTGPESNDIISYALQRRALITRACEVVETLGLPVGQVPEDPGEVLRSVAYIWAVSVHPDLMRWYRDAAWQTQSKCHRLRLDDGVAAVTGIERLVTRDLKVFTMTLDVHQSLPADMQKHVIEIAPQMHPSSTIASPLRLAAVVPATLLLAWDQAWRDAIDEFSTHAGDVVQTPPALEGFQSRIDNLEESVQVMRNRFVALSAAAEIPSDYN